MGDARGLGGAEALAQRLAPSDDGDVVAGGARMRACPSGSGSTPGLAAHRVQAAVLDVDHGTGVAHRLEQQEPMCAVLCEHGVSISASTYYEWITKTPTRRQLRDAELVRDHHGGKGDDRKTGKFVQTLGSRKMWIRLRGQGHDVARCTVERIMREQGWEGACYGSKLKTTIADDSHARYPDLVDRRFYAAAPNRLWVADL